MRTNFRDLDGLAYREIRARLERAGMPDPMIEQTITEIKHDRATRANHKRQTKERNKRWGEVIASLQHERRILRGMVRYKTKTPAPERDEFVQQYFAALTRLYEKLTARKSMDRELPEHSHWTDYVPEHVKQAFINAANDVPPRDRAKMKEPFQRTDPLDLAGLRRGRMLRYARATLDSVRMRLDANPDDAAAIRKNDLLLEAIKRVNELPPNAHIPNHWADLVRDKLHPDDDTQTERKPKDKDAPKKRARARAPKQSESIAEIVKSASNQQQHFNHLMVRQPLTATLSQFIQKIETDGAGIDIPEDTTE